MQMQTALDYGELAGLGIALALGLLVGIQRGWAQRQEPAGHRFAGIRTYGLLGFAGGISGTLQHRVPGLAVVLMLATAALVVAGYWRTTQREDTVSGTASLTGLITLTCGFLAGSGEYALASAGTGVTVLVLAMRRRLHHWLRHMDEREMLAIARFALIALVILPLLPDTAYGPYHAWRPRQLWLIVVLVSGFSFAGYAATRLLGASRGVLATAAAGAMVSSTAVTASLAGKLRDPGNDAAVCNAGIALASAVMFLRIMVLTGALAGFALPTLAKLAGPGMIASLIATALILRSRHDGVQLAQDDPTVALRNPFDLGPALALMVLTMVLTVAAHWVLNRYGDAGLATVLAISGVVDVDSAIITMGNLPPGTLAPHIAGLVLVPPFMLNTLFKTTTLLGIAGWQRGWQGAVAMLGSIAVAAAGLLLVL
jgi:uncharacterized membrane protein (DUF4010 family)